MTQKLVPVQYTLALEYLKTPFNEHIISECLNFLQFRLGDIGLKVIFCLEIERFVKIKLDNSFWTTLDEIFMPVVLQIS